MKMKRDTNTIKNKKYQLLLLMHCLIFPLVVSCAIGNNSYKLHKCSMSDQSFEQYLCLFEEINSNDTVCIDCRLLKINTNDTSLQIGKREYRQFSGTFIPLFQSFPLYKIQFPNGFLTFMLHYYDATYMEVMYLEVISYNLCGVIMGREIFPAWNGYGGTIQSESYSNNAKITLTKSSLDYFWNEQYVGEKPICKIMHFKINPLNGMLECIDNHVSGATEKDSSNR